MAAAARPPAEVINLLSDSEDELPFSPTAQRHVQFGDMPEELPPNSPQQIDEEAARDEGSVDSDDQGDFFLNPPMPGQFYDPAVPGDRPEVPLVIEDFGHLYAEPQQEAGVNADQADENLDYAQPHGDHDTPDDREQVMSKADCLRHLYEMFPGLCPDHASSIYSEVSNADADLPVAVYLDRMIEKLLADAPYPKRRKQPQQLKRKREESAEEDRQRWEREDREQMPRFLNANMRHILKADFPTFTHASINEVLNEEKYLFKAYVRLAAMRDSDGNVRRRGRPSVSHADADLVAANSGWPPISEELAAARLRVQADQVKRMEEAKKKQSEDDNLQRAIAAGSTAECQACFDDLPMNRQTHCHGETPHFTCFSCMEAYIKSEIGDSRCRVLCTAGCGAGFEPAQLNLLSDKKLLAKLADLQQEKDIRDAGLEDLEECPFCDFKAILPPIEEDFEFRCANPECEKVSCRRCKATSHIPISCEQHAKDNQISNRHKIEEAMTAALIRSCNRCKKQFIKEYGCNKMTCPSCHNLQCYVCSETLKGYDHFDQRPGGRGGTGRYGKCPLYDNLEERHEREIKAAEEAARAEVVANNPDVRPEDLEISVSDAVKQSTEQKIRQAGPEGLGGGPRGWAGLGFIGGAMPGQADDGDDDEDAAAARRAGPAQDDRRQRRIEQLNRRREQILHLRGLVAERNRRQQPGALPPAAPTVVRHQVQGLANAPNLNGTLPGSVNGFVQQPVQQPFVAQPAYAMPNHQVMPFAGGNGMYNFDFYNPAPPQLNPPPPVGQQQYPVMQQQPMGYAPPVMPLAPYAQPYPAMPNFNVHNQVNGNGNGNFAGPSGNMQQQPPVPPGRFQEPRGDIARLARVHLNLHDLELMRQQHDARHGQQFRVPRPPPPPPHQPMQPAHPSRHVVAQRPRKNHLL